MYFLNNSANPAQIKVSTLPIAIGRGRWRLEMPRARASHSFYWVTRGQGTVTIGGQIRGYAPNTLVFIPAGTVHALVPSKSALGYLAVLPDNPAIPVPQTPSRIHATSIFDQGRITGYFESMATEFSAQNTGSDAAVASYLTLLSIWIERNKNRNNWKDPQKDRRSATASVRLLGRYLAWIEKSFDTDAGVATAAQALKVTPTHLSRVCNELLKKSALAVLQDRVILQASVMLADGDSKIRQISESLGIRSAAYFSRLFARHQGMSPRQFRTRNQPTKG